MCQADGCDRAVYARQLCGRHYKQQQRHGAVQSETGPRPCAADGCDRQAVTQGWCHGHYLRWSRTGAVKADVPLARPVRDDCRVDGCGRPRHSGGLCRTHVGRERATGAVAEEVPVRRAGGEGSISHGYRKVVVPPGLLWLTGGERNILEHRLVMAQLLGRALLPGELVHHRNGDRLDNRKEQPGAVVDRPTAGPAGRGRAALRLRTARRLRPCRLRRPPVSDMAPECRRPSNY